MTKKDIIAECKRILHKTEMNAYVTPEEFAFLISEFKKASYWKEKTEGYEIIGIVKHPCSYGTPCFWLERSNNTFVDFSYTKMGGRSKLQEISEALREAISDEIRFFRETFQPFKWEDRIIQTPKEAHIHHYDLEFGELIKLWVENHGGIDVIYPKLTRTKTGDTFIYLNDEKLVEDFKQFHDANTHLIWIPEDVHKKLHHK